MFLYLLPLWARIERRIVQFVQIRWCLISILTPMVYITKRAQKKVINEISIPNSCAVLVTVSLILFLIWNDGNFFYCCHRIYIIHFACTQAALFSKTILKIFCHYFSYSREVIWFYWKTSCEHFHCLTIICF